MKALWKTQGYCVVDNFFPKSDLLNAMQRLETLSFPNTHDFGSYKGVLEFPTEHDSLNDITLHPNLITTCQHLLDSEDIRLIQSDIWSKTTDHTNTANSNQDQRMHMDYPNNYLTYPSDWNNPESVAIIIYYSDSEKCGGETSLVPKLGDHDPLYKEPYDKMAGLGEYPFNNDKILVETDFKIHHPAAHSFRQHLYEREISIPFKPGSVLFYRHDLWHRGTPTNPGHTRIIQNIGFKKSNCDWITSWNKGWARKLCDYTNPLERLLMKSSNAQRVCLGIPDNKNKYWTEKTRNAMKMRYNLSKL
jgi:hypothetical protein